MRHLATIQKIISISPIPNADKIELAQVLGWQCVVKKNEFNIGDMVVYVEVDSILPEKPAFEFLRERKFRIKIIRLKKTISEGIIFPIDILPKNTNIKEGDDVTDILGITKYDPQLQEESNIITKPKSKLHKLLMRFKPFRYIYLKLTAKYKNSWPSWIPKTDEDRIQICASMLTNNFNKEWYITEKIDGTSLTAFTYKTYKWGIPVYNFGVCSRNMWLKTPDTSVYWKIAKLYNLKTKLKSLKRDIVIQGECISPKIQGNKYKVTDPDFYVFNIIERGKRVTLHRMIEICNALMLRYVPVIYDSYIPCNNISSTETPNIIQELVKLSIDNSKLKKDIYREGIVLRLVNNPNVSFKVINPEFLLKYE